MNDFFDNIENIEVHNTNVVLDNIRNHDFCVYYDCGFLDVYNLTLEQFIKVFKNKLDAVYLSTEENIKYTIIEYKFDYSMVASSSSFVVHLYVHNSFQTVEDACLLLDAFDVFGNKLNIREFCVSVMYINLSGCCNFSLDVSPNDLFYLFKWNEFIGEWTSECFENFSHIINKLTDNKFSSDDYDIYITNRYRRFHCYLVENEIYDLNRIFNDNLSAGTLTDILQIPECRIHRKRTKHIDDSMCDEILSEDFPKRHKMNIKKLLQLSTTDDLMICYSINEYLIRQCNFFMWRNINYNKYERPLKDFIENYRQLSKQTSNRRFLGCTSSATIIEHNGEDLLSCCFHLGNILVDDKIYLISVNFCGKPDSTVKTIRQLFH